MMMISDHRVVEMQVYSLHGGVLMVWGYPHIVP